MSDDERTQTVSFTLDRDSMRPARDEVVWALRWEDDFPVIAGWLDHEPMRAILAAVDPSGPGATLRIGG